MLIVVAVASVIGLVVGLAFGRRRAGSADLVPQPNPLPPDPIADVLREAVDQLDLGVVVCGSSGEDLYRNRSAIAMAGTHTGLIVDDHVARLMERAREGSPVDEQVDLHGPPKTTLMLIAEPMASGAAVATIQDVSERVRIDAMRTDFVANVSHELKTPVGAIAVLAEALIDEDDVEVVRRVSRRMTDESYRAVRAIDDLLELSRIESGVRTDEVVDLRAVVQAAIARGDVAENGRGVRVTSLDAAADVQLRADGRQLVSALGNLIENAVKYSDDGGVVQVRTRADGNGVEVMVVDQGVGIPSRDLDRIFERFYRVDKARSRETGGTGLGLAIVRHVATNHGGEILVSSQEGEGSTFVLRLPADLIVEDLLGDDVVTDVPQGRVERTDVVEEDMEHG